MNFISITFECLIYIILTFLIAQHAEAGVVCGGLGSYNTSATTFFMGNFFFRAQSVFALCGDFCKSDARCRSFRYSYFSDADAQYCEFFNLYAEDYFLPDSSQPYYFYDVDCPLPAFALTEFSGTTTTTTTINLPASTITTRITTTKTSTISRTTTTSLSFGATRTSTRLGTITQIRYSTITRTRTITSTVTRR